MVVGVERGGADGRGWGLSNDGEVSPCPLLASGCLGAQLLGVRGVEEGKRCSKEDRKSVV